MNDWNYLNDLPIEIQEDIYQNRIAKARHSIQLMENCSFDDAAKKLKEIVGQLCNKNPHNRPECAPELLPEIVEYQNSETIFRSIDLFADEIIEQHLPVLCKKKKRLAIVDDYGVSNLDKWNSELEYFFTHVLKPRLDRHISVYLNPYGEEDKASEYEWLRNSLLTDITRSVDLALTYQDNPTLSYADDITPEDYEHFCADILNNAGWIAVVTKGSGDQGVDVVAEKDNFRLAIQCKKYSKPVGNKAVQEAYSGGAFYEANACAVVAPIEFTPAAKELAHSLGVHLFHHDDLVTLAVTSPDEE